MTRLDRVAVPTLARPCRVRLCPIGAYDTVAHRDEARAAIGPLPFPELLPVLGILVEAATPVTIVTGWYDRAGAVPLAGGLLPMVTGGYAPASEVAHHPLPRGPQAASIQP